MSLFDSIIKKSIIRSRKHKIDNPALKQEVEIDVNSGAYIIDYLKLNIENIKNKVKDCSYTLNEKGNLVSKDLDAAKAAKFEMDRTHLKLLGADIYEHLHHHRKPDSIGFSLAIFPLDHEAEYKENPSKTEPVAMVICSGGKSPEQMLYQAMLHFAVVAQDQKLYSMLTGDETEAMLFGGQNPPTENEIMGEMLRRLRGEGASDCDCEFCREEKRQQTCKKAAADKEPSDEPSDPEQERKRRYAKAFFDRIRRMPPNHTIN